jgi:hypothetical protein
MGESTEQVQAVSASQDDDQTSAASRDEEFARYYKERDDWVKTQLDAEKSYDALLVAISTLGLGASLTKDWVSRGSASGAWCLVFAWAAFAICLIFSLSHRFFTYYTHRKWVDTVDQAFRVDWKPGAMGRAEQKYDDLPFIRFVEWTKYIAGAAVLLGIISTFIFLCLNLGGNPPTSSAMPAQGAHQPASFSQVINIYAGATEPGMPPTVHAATMPASRP